VILQSIHHLNLKHARFDMQYLLLVLLVYDCRPCKSFSKTVGGDWRNPYSYICVQVHVRRHVRQSTVQCMIDGGESGRDGEFKRNEEVRVRGEFEQQQEDFLWLERYKKNVKARGHAL
jgi:hypothetical protein